MQAAEEIGVNGGRQDDNSDEEDGADFSLFTEPADFRPPTPPPSKAEYQLPVAPYTTIHLNLVGSHPLWAHHLWNASPILSNYLCKEGPSSLCQGRNVLELGAAAGLPSIVAHVLGAAKVVTTDYPDQPLIKNLQSNVDENVASAASRANCLVEGFIWGSDADKLKRHLTEDHFDLLLMSDLIFNHQAHGAMLDTMDACLPPATTRPPLLTSAEEYRPQALVFFTHHRPHLADKDMLFFKEAERRLWTCKEIGTWKMPPMFPNDPGSEEIRGTVHGWQVFR